MTVSFRSRKNTSLSLSSGKVLDFSGGPVVMGIVNCTPDSFYAGSRHPDPLAAVDDALAMAEEGAHILDIGGESSRPGAEYVGEDEELRRILPVIEALRRQSTVAISVDTRKEPVARTALDAGADIINDISALSDDPNLSSLAAERGVPVVLMHKRGVPKTMQDKPVYADPVAEVISELRSAAVRAESAGIAADRIIIDPGIGFGKRLSDNLAILKHLDEFSRLGYYLLVGVSRKSFIGAVLDAEPEDRLIGTQAVHAWSILYGADILRVHDVKETLQVLKILSAIRGA